MILASASPRRREMLTALGVEYTAVSPDVEELREGGAPEVLVLENARRKALAGLELAGAGEGDWALGVDTEVVLDGRLLGKAATVEEARSRLLALSGRTHEVLSGVVLMGVGAETDDSRGFLRQPPSETDSPTPPGTPAALVDTPPERSGIASSLVTFAELDGPILERYLASGEWRDRAGAYAIQGLGSLLVARLEGDLSNVVGLPLQLLLQLAPQLFGAVSSDSAGRAPNPRRMN